MNRAALRAHRARFVEATRAILRDEGTTAELAESSFPAYAHGNPLASFVFWSRIARANRCIERLGPLGRSLDFGCGGGVMLPVLAGSARQVLGFDICLEGVRAMQRHCPLPDNVAVTDSFDDVRQQAPFDLIVALDVLEHVEDLPGVFRSFVELLSPGGTVLVSGPTENFAYRLGRRLAGRDFTGHYHTRDIYDIRDEMQRFFDVTTVATLFHPVPLFKIYSGVPRRSDRQ